MTSTQPIVGRRRQAALGFIFVVALLDVISLGIMIPVLPNLIKQFAGGDTAHASAVNAVFATAWGVMQFFCSPIMGMVSDRYGRRPVILISVFSLGIDFLFMALAPTLAWLFVGRLINGACAASFGTAGAYIADVTPPEGRAKAFGVLGAAWGIGFILGPALGGWLAESTLFGLLDEASLRTPFFFAAALALVNAAYGVFILPESLPRERRLDRFDWRRANPLGAVRLLRSHPDLTGLAGVGFLFQLAHNVLPSIFILYTGHRYGWSPATVGLTMVLTGVLNTLVQALLVGPAVQRLGERGALLLGLAMGAFGFAWFALAPTGLIYLLGSPIFALSGLIGPGLQGLMTRRVGPSEQGQLQGAGSMLMGIGAIIGPMLFGLTFAWTVGEGAWLAVPGLAILIAAALLVAAFLLALRVARPAEPAEASRITETSSALP
jgi:DHA1 family tetracycline resistance protein-like MFS transporter